MYKFNFRCGNFTEGYGHCFTTDRNPKAVVINNLEKSGEKKCTVVFTGRAGSRNEYDDGTIYENFDYHITRRWYNSVIGAGINALPYIIPMVVGNKKNGTESCKKNE